MKTLRTIFFSLIAIVSSLISLISCLCAYGGGLGGQQERGSYVLTAIVTFVIAAASMVAVVRINRKSGDD